MCQNICVKKTTYPESSPLFLTGLDVSNPRLSCIGDVWLIQVWAVTDVANKHDCTAKYGEISMATLHKEHKFRQSIYLEHLRGAI